MNCTFVELKAFKRDIDKLQDSQAILKQIQQLILDDFTSGDLVQGTGGIRKLRVPGSGKGKSGGYRVWYLNIAEASKVYLLAIYAKGDLANLSTAQANELGKLVAQLKREARR